MTKHQSKIEKMIAVLCPEGVEFKKLGELEDSGLIKLGRGSVISKNDIAEIPGDYPVYSSSAVGSGEFGRYGKYMFEDERISWSVDGGGRFFYRPAQKYSVTNVSGWMKVKDKKVLNTRYLYYVLANAWATKTFNYSKKAHPSVIRNEYMVPVPPIKVQREIVKILDNFTELEAELKAELESRKKQYEYYTDELFNLKDVEHRALGEVGTFVRGKRFVKSDIVPEGVPCIHYGEMYTHYGAWAKEARSFLSPSLASRLRVAQPGNVVIVAAGETVEDIGSGVAWLGKSDVVIHDACFTFAHSLDPKYASYFLKTRKFRDQIKKYIASSKISSINADGLKKAIIPIPSVSVQEHIASVLDKFDALVNDVSVGLPAEIKARRRQYEYYRNKLLTFKEYVG